MVGRCSGRVRWPRWAAGPGARSSRPCTSSPQGARPPGADVVDGRRGRVRVLARARAGRLLRADPPRLAGRPPPGGCGLDRGTRPANESRTSPRCSPTTTCRRRARPRLGAADHAEELGAAAVRYLALAGERALGLDVDERRGHLARALALSPRPIRARAACSSAGLVRRNSRAGCTRRERRSRTRSTSIGRTGTRRPREDADHALDADRDLGDPRRGEPLAEAIALLEAEPPGPTWSPPTASWRAGTSSSSATGTGRSPLPSARSLSPRSCACPSPLGRAAFADCPGVPWRAGRHRRPATGDRPVARAGRSRDVAIFHNNLAGILWLYDGPAAALRSPGKESRLQTGAASPTPDVIWPPRACSTWPRAAVPQRPSRRQRRFEPSSKRAGPSP